MIVVHIFLYVIIVLAVLEAIKIFFTDEWKP